MASNRFRYPPAPGHGGDTFSDNLVGLQLTQGSEQMTMGNFSTESPSMLISAPPFIINNFSSPITLDSLNLGDLESAKQTLSNSIDVFLNTDTSDVTNLVLYGSLKKRFNVAIENIINKFPAALYIDGISVNNTSGNTTATNITYDTASNRDNF